MKIGVSYAKTIDSILTHHPPPIVSWSIQMANKKRTDNALNNLLASAGPEILRDLVSTLAFRDPEVRRECFEYLKAHAPLSTTQKQTSDG